MSKFVKTIKNMSKVQRMVVLGVSSVVVCGIVAGGILWHNDEMTAQEETHAYMAELQENVNKMDSQDIQVALENVTDLDEETREILEKKLEEKMKEDYPSVDNSENLKEEEEKKEESSNPKPEVKPEPKPETKPQPKPEVRPEPKPEVKPQPKPEPPKPTYPPKGFDQMITDKFNARLLEQEWTKDDSYSGMPAYTAIKNYALYGTAIPTDKLVHEKWGCKATGKVLTFKDTFNYTDDQCKWSISLVGGKLTGSVHNYQTILANYAICYSNGDGTFTVTVYTLDMTDL